MSAYYHGGRPGMKPGQLILPSSVTGARSLADHGASGVCRRDRVYVATQFEAACLYAAMYPSKKAACVYLVEPIGEIEPDPDCNLPGLSFSAEKARIVKVIKLTRTEVAMVREVVLS